MIRFLLEKILRVAIVLTGVVVLMFILMHAIPGGPWSNYSNSPRLLVNVGSDDVLRAELNRRFGLDQPLWRQFTRYFIGDFVEGPFTCGAICGNLGPSIQRRGLTVQAVLFNPPAGRTFWESRFGYSIRLVLLGALITIGLGLPLGIISATRPKSAFSRAVSVGLAAMISIPNFVLGLLAIIVLATWLKVMNFVQDWNSLKSWLLPAVILAIMPTASLARVTQASLANILSEEFVRTARAKGLDETRVILKHVLRNALAPILAFLGTTLLEMFTGLFIVENLYGFPGLGREYWEAVLWLDYPMILGLSLVYATGIVLTNIAVEILGGILDPRLRSSRLQGVE